MSQSTSHQTSTFDGQLIAVDSYSAEEDLRRFHRIFESPMADKPLLQAVDLRWNLIHEEVNVELREAIVKMQRLQDQEADCPGLHNQEVFDECWAEILDSIVDSVYVLVGTAAAFGLPFDAAWKEVQRSNMAKANPDGTVTKREDGKVLKPAGWTPPNIVDLIRRVKERKCPATSVEETAESR